MAYDLIVIGGRVAGASTAMLAARAGLKVLIVDRVSFPSDTLSTNYIHQPGCLRLARWGVLDKIIATGCPPIPRTRYQVGELVIEGGVSPSYAQIEAYAPRRYVLDSILFQAAADSGAETRQNCTLVDLIKEDDVCIGVTLKGPDNKLYTERARMIVGADGMRSTVARLAGAKTIVNDPNLTCAYYSFWQGLKSSYELYEGDNTWVGAVPTNDDILVATYFPQSEFANVRVNALKSHLGAVAKCAPGLYDRMSESKQVGKLWGTGDQRNFFREATGPGWALIGDAGHHKDSISARGITDALTQSELFVSRIKDHIDNPDMLRNALAKFARDRDTLMMPGYQATLAVAKLGMKERRLGLLDQIAGNEQYLNVYFDVVAGIRPPTDLQSLLDREKGRLSELVT